MATPPFSFAQNTSNPEDPNAFQKMRAAQEEEKKLKANTTKRERAEQYALQNVQQKEESQLVKYLKSQGVPANEINNIVSKERQANAQELSQLRQSQGSEAGYQASSFGDPYAGTVRSGMTYQESQPGFASKVQAGYDYITAHRTMQRFADKVGLPLSDAMRLAQLPTNRPVTVQDVMATGGAKHPEAVAKLANLLNSYGAGEIDASQLKGLKPVDGSPGVYTTKVKIRGGETVDAYFVKDEATGKYANTQNLYKHWNNKAGLGAFGIVLAVGIGLLAGPIGEALGSQIAGGAIAGAINAEVQGGDILKGAITGGIGSGVGQAVGGALGDLDIGGLPLSKEVVSAGSRLAGQTAAGLAGGQSLGKSFEAGLAGAAGGYAADKIFPGTVDPKTGKVDYSTGETLGRGLASNLVSTGVSKLFGPSSGGGTSRQTTSQPTMGMAPPASSQALSQALRVGDPGATLFGTGGKEGQRKNVWNTASLKLKDETGT